MQNSYCTLATILGFSISMLSRREQKLDRIDCPARPLMGLPLYSYPTKQAIKMRVGHYFALPGNNILLALAYFDVILCLISRCREWLNSLACHRTIFLQSVKRQTLTSQKLAQEFGGSRYNNEPSLAFTEVI